MELTALTRPRMWSGVASCTKEERMTTLITSAAPSTIIASVESQSERESAKTMVARPKTITALNMVSPTRRRSG